MRSYEERAQDFIKELFPYIQKCKTLLDYQLAILDYNVENNRRVHCCHGATRVCFITSDYCVKIDRDTPQLNDFGGCHDEYAMFHEASRDGMEEIFCPIHQYVYNRHYFYIMPKATCIGRGRLYSGFNRDEMDYLCDHVYDLHAYNVGKYNGRSVIVDYAAHR